MYNLTINPLFIISLRGIMLQSYLPYFEFSITKMQAEEFEFYEYSKEIVISSR